MKQTQWLIEPETGDRYVRNQDPNTPTPPFDQCKRLTDFVPPSTWGDFDPNWVGWDDPFLRRHAPEWVNLKHAAADRPIPVTLQAKHMALSYARKNGLRDLGRRGWGIVFWTWFPRIEPCWLVMCGDESYKMLTEQEAGVERKKN